MHAPPTSASAQVEQVSHSVCRHVERAHRHHGPAQTLDRPVLELDQSAYLRATTPRGMGDESPATGPAWQTLVCAFSYRTRDGASEESRNADHVCSRRENLCSRLEYH